MPDLLVDFITTVDGYGTSEGWPGLWGLAGPEYLDWIQQDEAKEHLTLMGAVTYREMAGYAEQMPDDPGLQAMTRLPKVVFSSSMQTPLPWANTELVATDAVEAITTMKRQPGPELRTVGSIRLCRSLFEAGLVDRLRVVVFPVITATTGKDRLFENYPDIALDLIDRRTFDDRVQLLEYVPTVLDSPPGVDAQAGV